MAEICNKVKNIIVRNFFYKQKTRKVMQSTSYLMFHPQSFQDLKVYSDFFSTAQPVNELVKCTTEIVKRCLKLLAFNHGIL